MLKGSFFSNLFSSKISKGVDNAGSTMALEAEYKDANEKYFKGRYVGVFNFNGLVRYQYEVRGGILLLEKLATEVNLSVHKGFAQVSDTYQTTYGKNQRLERYCFATSLSSKI